MSWSEAAVVVMVLVALVVWRVWMAANRLDRLHRKITASGTALRGQLVRRATDAVALGSSGVLDPVSSVLVLDAAWAALAADGVGDPETERAESELSRVLRTVFEDSDEIAALRADPAAAALIGDLAGSWDRAQLARRFHNEAVAQTQRVRRKAWVRLFRLAGHAPMPQTVELDDSWPEALPPPGTDDEAEHE